MRIAVTGAAGQLGRQICHELGANAIPIDLPEVDITDRDATLAFLRSQRPEAIINCAAYTLVDKAEDEPEICRKVNADAVACLADAAIELDCPLAQISTDYVYAGNSPREQPWRETDQPCPRGVYAITKWEGEQQTTRAPRHLILRTCGLYGVTPRRNNFVETMLRLARERDVLRVVNDQQCTPTNVVHLARAVLYLLDKQHVGLYHVVSRGATTWHAFAAEIFRLSGVTIRLEPITTEQFGARAPRPAFSVLDTSKYHALGGPPMPTWQTALAEYLNVHRPAEGNG